MTSSGMYDIERSVSSSNGEEDDEKNEVIIKNTKDSVKNSTLEKRVDMKKSTSKHVDVKKTSSKDSLIVEVMNIPKIITPPPGIHPSLYASPTTIESRKNPSMQNEDIKKNSAFKKVELKKESPTPPPTRQIPTTTIPNKELMKKKEASNNVSKDNKIFLVLKNIQDAQNGKKSGLPSHEDVLMELKDDMVRSSALDYICPLHTMCFKRHPHSSPDYHLKDFSMFGLYLVTTSSFPKNLTRTFSLMASKLCANDRSEVFEEEESVIHVFESATLYLLAAAILLRSSMKGIKKSSMKMNAIWKQSQMLFKKKKKNVNIIAEVVKSVMKLISIPMFERKLCARVVDEIVVFEGYHDFVNFRTVSDVKKYLKKKDNDEQKGMDASDVVGELLTEAEASSLPRESFAHGHFENDEKVHCWLSTSFQSLWHSKVFHSAFENLVVLPISKIEGGAKSLKTGCVTRGLVETWIMYKNAAGRTWGYRGNMMNCENV